MDKLHYKEMLENLNSLEKEEMLDRKNIYLFGHCNATEELADLMIEKGYYIRGILDNNISKQGTKHKNILIVSPENILDSQAENTIVCIVARAYAAMVKQLNQMGYKGRVEQLVNYNSYSEYSLSEETLNRKLQRVRQGMEILEQMKEKYPQCYRIYCPFCALGDVYYMMSYLPYFLERNKITEYVVFSIGQACTSVVKMFGVKYAEALSQREMDEQIQAMLYSGDESAFIAHHDRPYVVNVYKILYIKRISLEMLYKYGVFALEKSCKAYRPSCLETYEKLDEIPEGKAVIISPYAKSVTNIEETYWEQIIKYFKNKGYDVYTNAVGEEKTLSDTIRLEIPLAQLQSVVEKAGIFIGIRSGLCDVIKWADCRKIALYPDCFYSDTRWKMEEIYHLDGWENIVIR